MKTIFTLLLMLCGVSAWAAPVGEIAMLKGNASIVRGDQNISAKVQMPIMEQDLINTHENGKLQLIFIDNTVITLGENTSFSIADYLYDERNSRAEFAVGSGTFKVITGSIGKLAPKSFLLKTKTSLIGIRGTIFTGDVGVNNAEGSGDLLACLKGSISVQSLLNQSKVNIDNGKMVFVDDAGNFGAIRNIDAQILPQLNNVQTQESQENHHQEIDDISSNSLNSAKKVAELDNIHQLIANQKTVHYRGHLNGTSHATITDSNQPSSQLELQAKIKAAMDMNVDFGGNDPLKIKLNQQQVEFTKVVKNGSAIDAAAYNAVANTTNMNLNPELELAHQKIDATSRTIEAHSQTTVNRLSKDVRLTGQFSDNHAQGISGELTERASGRFGADHKTIDRKIMTQFDARQQ